MAVVKHLLYDRSCPHCGSENTACVLPECASKKLCNDENELKCSDCSGIFWQGKQEAGRYQCPHCQSWHTRYWTSDSDMGLDAGRDVYVCTDCGRPFDEPPEEKTVGLSRA